VFVPGFVHSLGKTSIVLPALPRQEIRRKTSIELPGLRVHKVSLGSLLPWREELEEGVFTSKPHSPQSGEKHTPIPSFPRRGGRGKTSIELPSLPPSRGKGKDVHRITQPSPVEGEGERRPSNYLALVDRGKEKDVHRITWPLSIGGRRKTSIELPALVDRGKEKE